MATFGKQLLSASVDGRPIKVVATATAGTLVHTAVAWSADIDEVWLYCVNTDTVTRTLTIEFGGTTSPDDLIEIGIPAEAGLVLVCPGLLLQNSRVVRAFGSAANVLCVSGYVNRITA